MAASHIIPAVNTPYAPQIQAAARSLNATYEQLDTLKRLMDQMVNGADYTMLESVYGLTAGQGTIVYALIAGALAQIYNAGSGSCMQTISYLG